MPDGEHLVPFGRAAVARAGSDVTVIGIAVMVQRALAAAEVLAREGVSVEVIDPRTLAPLDLDTILEPRSRRPGRLLIADESYGPCGIGAEIAAQVADRDSTTSTRRSAGSTASTPPSPTARPSRRRWCRTWTPSSEPCATSVPSSARHDRRAGLRRRRVAGPGVRGAARPERPAGHAAVATPETLGRLRDAGTIRLRGVVTLDVPGGALRPGPRAPLA